jgi:catechol 2,3-dioxygenase-like lactoylglutathione lyase family enzyme
VPVTIDELIVAGEPQPWAANGFRVDGSTCIVGDVRMRFAGAGANAGAGAGGRGLIGWSLRGIEVTDLDGLPTSFSDREPPCKAETHSNGVTAVDHVVAMTPDLDRSVAGLEAAGLDLRRVRNEPTPAGAPRQAFFRLGSTILEVVQEPDGVPGRDGRAFFWGLALVVPDLDQAVARLGEHVSRPRPAVQPGRRIATLRRSAGLPLPVALMTPPGGDTSP